jgi:hypothetical protein
MPQVVPLENPLGNLSLLSPQGNKIEISNEEQLLWSSTLDRITTIAIASPNDFSLSRDTLLRLLGKEHVVALREKSYIQAGIDGSDEIITLFTFYRSRFPSAKQ